MYNNYQYFLILAEEHSISRAADRLFITHQSLSKYLANLEQELGVLLFRRKPFLTLTPSGELLLETFRKVELMEKNIHSEIDRIKGNEMIDFYFGITPSRMRILMPNILTEFKQKFPYVNLHFTGAPSPQLYDLLADNKLDMIMAGIPPRSDVSLQHTIALKERLYIVVSDDILKQVFPSDFPACKAYLRNGADLSLFASIPFLLETKQFNSTIMFTNFMEKEHLSLHCEFLSGDPDLHHILTSRNMGISIGFSMYLKEVRDLNDTLMGNHLNAFPIKGLDQLNSYAITYKKERILPSCGAELINIIKRQCSIYKNIELF
ncbi:LysR family transcriptional regulator [Clostridium sp. AF12-19]|nr:MULTISPECIES: LysR family transcriptional regulator [unclassified Clostridium]RHS24518.1 LysR family transcriptional regulator [Clostridium sp. AF12-28]RHS26705.1 LysR family transcriptional regulator [Clostridium sp. AF12-19]